jgi:membrane protein DedA with SNARE-associated domain
MHNTLDFLFRHGYVVLLAWVFAEQAGLPIPAVPLLLAAGALAGTGRLNLFGSLLITVAAAVAADATWYEMGRRKGNKVLQFLCKISLEPDSCVRRTEGIFAEHGARSLLVAKFLPGLSTIAPPLAGVFKMTPLRFFLFDVTGSILWAASFLGLGYAFTGQIEQIAAHATALGSWLLVILIGSLLAYIAWKFIARYRFLRELRIARITPEELKQKLDAGEDVVIVDLRHSMDFEADPKTIPGAFRMDATELQEKSDRLPRDREVILYCT